MGKTVAITGVNSYFASTLLPRLQADPEIEKIIGIDVTPWKGGYDKVAFVREDVRNPEIGHHLRGADTLYHLAFIVDEIADKQKTYDINIKGSRNVFQACVEKGIRKVIYASSITVYGSHPDTPLGLTEDHPPAPNTDSYYNSSKVDVEQFAARFFADHPEIVVTVLRAGLLCGPRIENMFSKLWSMKIGALAAGSKAYLQFIHEEDLGEAMYLACLKDLPGTFNVAADDAVSARWVFRRSGVFIIPIPSLILKPLADLSFKLKLFPAGGGWVSLSSHTIFCRCDRFKSAAGWKPRYSSEETFNHYLAARVRDARDNPIQAILSWVFSSGPRIRPTMTVLNVFRLGRIPGFTAIHPWMNPKKNSMSYLPINLGTAGGSKTIQIEESAGEAISQAAPPAIIHDFIEKTNFHVIMDKCGCRLAGNCQHFTPHIGCLFMGETALKLPHGVSRRVTREQAHAHVDKAISVGLVPITGKIRVDNFIFLTPDHQKLLSVCFCCHCCCMMGAFRHLPAKHLDRVMKPLEGVAVEVTDACIGCGTCIKTCIFQAISIENGRALHSDKCRSCGRCATNCPQEAVRVSITDPSYRGAAEKRIESYVRLA